MTLSERMEALRAKKSKEYKDEREAAWNAVKDAEEEFFDKHKKDLEDLNETLLKINAIADSSGLGQRYSPATIGAARSFLRGLHTNGEGLHPCISISDMGKTPPQYNMEITVSDKNELYPNRRGLYIGFYFYGGDTKPKARYGTHIYICQIDTKEESDRYVALFKRAEEGIPVLKKRIEEFMEALG